VRKNADLLILILIKLFLEQDKEFFSRKIKILLSVREMEEKRIRSILFSESCSTFLLIENQSPVFIGHNLDENAEIVPGSIFINKHGEKKKRISHKELVSGKFKSCTDINWTAKYGSITFNVYGKDFCDGGMNEAGLYIQEMTLQGGIFPKNKSLPCFFMTLWMQYVLDNFTSVKEVVENLSAFNIEGWPWHFFVSDANGNPTCIDFVEGKTKIYTGKDMPFPVMTNFFHDRELDELRMYQGFGGQIPFNFKDMGTLEPRRDTRFVHACRLIKDAPMNTDVDYAFKILYAMDRTPMYKIGGRHWSYVIDIKAQQIYFETRNAPNRKYFDFNGFNFSNTEPAKIIDIHTNLEGDVTGNFQSISKEKNDQIITKGLGYLKKLADQILTNLKTNGAIRKGNIDTYGGEKMWSEEAFKNLFNGLSNFSDYIL
jgi:penicillin V acylase-like amidase (Ntn superfamily)